MENAGVRARCPVDSWGFGCSQKSQWEVSLLLGVQFLSREIFQSPDWRHSNSLAESLGEEFVDWSGKCP